MKKLKTKDATSIQPKTEEDLLKADAFRQAIDDHSVNDFGRIPSFTRNGKYSDLSFCTFM